MRKKNVYLLSIPSATPLYLPLFWASAKTYYETHGKYPDEYNWVLPYAEFMVGLDAIKKAITNNPPDIFGISLYVWNYTMSMELCSWVKETWPHCIVIVGGPHQYVTFQSDFFLRCTFVDACSPDTAYGELVMTDLLDNIQDDGTVNWGNVEQILYPSKQRGMILTGTKKTRASEFDWSFSAYSAQLASMHRYVDIKKICRPNASLGIRIETTRGCPYQCTYCDWGGTLGSKMAKKTDDAINGDLSVLSLAEFDISIIHFCDSNTGIFGKRDVDTFRLMVEKTNCLGDNRPVVNISGWAKSTVHLKYIKEILEVTASTGLIDALKISIQTFDSSSLVNVKRTDIAADEYFMLGDYARSLGCTIIAEMIMGFPGLTLDKFYKEFDQPYERDIEVRFYEWQLLPQSEAYSPDYRKQFKLGTAVNNNRTPESIFNIANETVVESYSYSRNDYAEMMTVYSLYILITIGEIYSKSIQQLLDRNGWRISDFLKEFHHTCYPLLEAVNGKNNAAFRERKIAHTTVKDSTSSSLSTIYSLLLLEDFWEETETQAPIIRAWLLAEGAESSTVDSEYLELTTLTEDVIVARRARFIDANKIRTKKKIDKSLFTNSLASTHGLNAR